MPVAPSRNGHISASPTVRSVTRSSLKTGRVTTSDLANRINVHIGTKQKKKTKTPSVMTAEALMALDLPEPECIVHKLIPEGLSILVSRPKLGKSWLALALAIAISLGRFALGSLVVKQGDVLYLAMEDNARRLQSRMRKLLRGSAAPGRLTLATQWPRLDEGGYEKIREWAKAAEEPRLVVIDTLAKVRPTKTKQADRYADDYKDVGDVQHLTEELGIAILLLHHDRKAQAEDAVDDVSGSIGITAAVDTILLLKRERGSHDACLSVHGRDIDEQELALSWDNENCWSLMDKSVKEARMSEARLKVLECVKEHGPITPKEVSTRLNKKENNVKQLLHSLAKAGDVKSIGGRYTAITQ